MKRINRRYNTPLPAMQIMLSTPKKKIQKFGWSVFMQMITVFLALLFGHNRKGAVA